MTVPRAKATALVLVNWKGVFYERYLLDHNVTALEGANGAGKTTVMIAAYVVLFPDLGRLRFTNVGESGATGGDRGLWGRLGEVGRPSYAAIQIELGQECVLLGVHLERKTEPSLHLTPFLVRGLGSQVRLAEVLLRQVDAFDEIPTLQELKAKVVDLGGTAQLFNTSKDYFAKLFDLGISPLRLNLDEERNKFNDMLRTSMTGGISRTLTSELRWFVFRQDTGLSDTLGRMRGSLDACRRTRTEVIESRRLEAEVNGIYEAGLHMFATGYFAARNLAQELHDGLVRAQQQREEAQQLARQRALEASALNTELSALAEHLEQLESARGAARDDAARLTRAMTTLQRLASLRGELDGCQESQRRAHALQQQTTLKRTQLLAERKLAQEALAKSAAGLANLQSGLDELHRRAHAHRVFRRYLDEVTSHLQVDEGVASSDEYLAAAQADTSDKLHTIDTELVACQRDGALLQAQRSEYERGMRALGALEQACAMRSGESELIRARIVLSHLQRLELQGAAVPVLTERLRGLQQRASARADLLSRLAAVPLLNDRLPNAEAAEADEADEAQLSRRGVSKTDALPSVALRARFDALETRLLELETAHRDAEWQLKTGEQSLRQLDAELRALQEQQAEWQRTQELAVRVSPENQPLSPHKDALRRRQLELEARIRELQHGILQAEQRAETARTQAAAIEDTAGVINPALLELADELEGELVVRRFEDLELEAASTIEAELGPLVDGIVVEDTAAAATKLRSMQLALDHVWLIEPGVPLITSDTPSTTGAGQVASLFPNDDGLETQEPSLPSESANVVVNTPYGKRVSRRRETASLGRKARERRLAALRKTASQSERVGRELADELARLETLLQDANELARSTGVWVAGDQSPKILELRDSIARRRSELATFEETIRSVPNEIGPLREAVERIRPLLGSASLLDFSSLEEEKNAAELALSDAQNNRALVESLTAVRQELSETLEALRHPPPAEESVREWQARRDELRAERDRLFQLLESVRQLRANSFAREWGDAQRRLAEAGGLVPALEQEHEESIQRLQRLETRLSQAEAAWEEQTAIAQKASGEVVALQAHISRNELELETEGLLGANLAEQERRLVELNQECERLDSECATERASAQAKAADAARLDERRNHANEDEKRAAALYTQLQSREAPARGAWEELSTRARESGTLSLLSRESLQDTYSRAPSIELGTQRDRHWTVLLERLQRASSGQKLVSELTEEFADLDSAEALVGAWSKVREWLAERVPARIAQSGDPLESLSRLRDELSRLEQRLSHQETALRGESRDVARNIEVQIRRATNQVRRLNQHLSRVSFGTIASIRIRLERVERTAKVLEALHDGSAQSLLFHSTLPIEEAMDEIFRRYGGGKGGGQKLLDYREYVELTVEIQRKNADEWERANPSRLSTGEAIGVGAALMMVILTEWERDANLMRAQKTQGTLRFLFLDEANRLSRDNLGVLFELCETLELQLLIAAPEVAQVDGNTTYRLVRRVNDTGEEEVVVTGRRGNRNLDRDSVAQATPELDRPNPTA